MALGELSRTDQNTQAKIACAGPKQPGFFAARAYRHHTASSPRKPHQASKALNSPIPAPPAAPALPQSQTCNIMVASSHQAESWNSLKTSLKVAVRRFPKGLQLTLLQACRNHNAMYSVELSDFFKSSVALAPSPLNATFQHYRSGLHTMFRALASEVKVGTRGLGPLCSCGRVPTFLASTVLLGHCKDTISMALTQ